MAAATILQIFALIVTQIIALIAGQARFYSLCLKVSLKNGYLFLFLPAIVALIVWVLVSMNVIPLSWKDEIMLATTILGQVATLVAIYRLLSGNCGVCLTNNDNSINN